MSLLIFKRGASKRPKFNAYRVIVKIQKALDGTKGVLIYNKDKTFIDQLENDFSTHLKDDLKGYFKVTIKNGNVKILKRLEDRDW
jgi:hypothetical protein